MLCIWGPPQDHPSAAQKHPWVCRGGKGKVLSQPSLLHELTQHYLYSKLETSSGSLVQLLLQERHQVCCSENLHASSRQGGTARWGCVRNQIRCMSFCSTKERHVKKDTEPDTYCTRQSLPGIGNGGKGKHQGEKENLQTIVNRMIPINIRYNSELPSSQRQKRLVL